MDFYRIVTTEKKDGTLQIRPDWKVGRSKDLMTRGGSFYAVWDEERSLWSTDIYDVQRLVDADLKAKAQVLEEKGKKAGVICSVMTLESNGSKLWDEFQRFMRNSGNHFHNLDEKLIFSNTEVKKEDYASKRLDYSLGKGPHSAWDTVVSTLYRDDERAKIEWAIGAVVSGDSKSIQKFLVFYGPPGSGKSTILNIIEKLFHGYTAVFDARELAGNNNAFATSAFKANPLVAIQHDGDLSRIYDNTKLNSIVAHETIPINEKYKAAFESKSNAFLFMGTNLPVKISDAKSGIIRRLIDVVPTQQTIETEEYHVLMNQINFELGAIAQYCLDRYKTMGKNYYSAYRPTEMMLQTDVFYNYVESCFDIFKADNGVSLKRAWSLYKEYCSDTGIDKIMPQYKFREELKNYFFDFEERATEDGVAVRSYYRGFKHLEPMPEMPIKTDGAYKIELGDGPSIFDQLYPGMPAQYGNEEGTPANPWANVTTTLSDLDTRQLHWVKVPDNHIVIDFDLVNENGDKDLALNLAAAEKLPKTYTELSKSGYAVHLHYIYSGDVNELALLYDENVEIKRFPGNSSLRRKLTKCNNVNITPLAGGLPKKEKPLITNQSMKNEKSVRDLLGKCLRKEVHPGTKPNVDFMYKILQDAYDSNMAYDVSDMRPNILTFALKSTNQSEQCMKVVQKMQFVGKNTMPELIGEIEDIPLTFFDIEVFPNLLVICWKHENSPTVVRMVNPEPAEIEPLFAMRLVGFNNRRYDNHILYARWMGYKLDAIYNLSFKLTSPGYDKTAYFGEAYNLSYTDVFDFSSKKQGLKKFMIELDIHHVELDLPWDEPVPDDMMDKVVEYCVNDVIGLQKVFESRKQDFVARQILASMSGLSVNHTTQMHTAKIIFGEDKDPQRQFVYTDLGRDFPGYKYGSIKNEETGKDIWGSLYRGEITGEGGYVYAEPGFYENVALLDVASMHPTSIIELNAFGPYTEKFKELLDARLAIKRRDYDAASKMLNGKLAPYLVDREEVYDISSAEDLSYALKIVINIVYGLTSASFPNSFKDMRNKDNIVAKRGALFMIDLKHAVQEEGFTVAHIKTDSIKIPNATQEIIDFVFEFGKKYGYDFEHEQTYKWLCLVNEAVYIAKGWDDKYTAVGAQFQHPYVFKTLFSKEELEFDDFCETKSVMQGAMYLDFTDNGNPDEMLRHVGRTGSFIPVKDGGGVLWRIKDDKKYAVTGTKGYLWINRDQAVNRNQLDNLNIDMSYFEKLKQDAIDAMTQFDEVKGLSSALALG